MAVLMLLPVMVDRMVLLATEVVAVPRAEVVEAVAGLMVAEAEAVIPAAAVGTQVAVVVTPADAVNYEVDVNDVNDRGGKGVLTGAPFLLQTQGSIAPRSMFQSSPSESYRARNPEPSAMKP